MRKKDFVSWLPVILYCFLIFYLSSRPSFRTGLSYSEDFIFKKVAHFFEYFILAFLVFRALSRTTIYSRLKIFCFTLSFCFLYAVSDELHQSFVPGRDSHLRDVLIDTLGALSAATLLQARLR